MYFAGGVTLLLVLISFYSISMVLVILFHISHGLAKIGLLQWIAKLFFFLFQSHQTAQFMRLVFLLFLCEFISFHGFSIIIFKLFQAKAIDHPLYVRPIFQKKKKKKLFVNLNVSKMPCISHTFYIVEADFTNCHVLRRTEHKSVLS